MRFRRDTVLAAGLVASLAAGCTTVTETFPDESPEQVWTALIAVAETPDYGSPDPAERWLVRRNDVWVDPEVARIEIYRVLDRVRQLPMQEPRRDSREWRLQVTFLEEPHPTATFTSRGLAIPAHAQAEAARYFADVHRLLDGEAELVPVAVETVEVEADAPEAPPVDLEALEPDGG